MRRTAKAWVAAIGGTLTAATTALAAVSLALADDAIDVAEVGALATAAATLVGTVYGVWRVENEKPIKSGTTATQNRTY